MSNVVMLMGLLCAVAAPAQVPKASVVILPLQAIGTNVEAGLAEAITSFMASEAGVLPAYRIVTFREIEGTLSQAQLRQVSGCDSSACAAEIAGALNTDQIVQGSLARVGDSYLVTLARIRARDAVVLMRMTERLPANQNALLDAVPRLVARLFKDSGGPASAAPSQPAPSAPIVAAAPPSQPAAPAPSAAPAAESPRDTSSTTPVDAQPVGEGTAASTASEPAASSSEKPASKPMRIVLPVAGAALMASTIPAVLLALLLGGTGAASLPTFALVVAPPSLPGISGPMRNYFYLGGGFAGVAAGAVLILVALGVVAAGVGLVVGGFVL